MSSLTEKDLRRHLNNFDWQFRAALWKRCAKKQHDRIRLETEYSESIEKASKEMEAELAALKNDAREMALELNGYKEANENGNNCLICRNAGSGYCDYCRHDILDPVYAYQFELGEAYKTALRILEATKEGE